MIAQGFSGLRVHSQPNGLGKPLYALKLAPKVDLYGAALSSWSAAVHEMSQSICGVGLAPLARRPYLADYCELAAGADTIADGNAADDANVFASLGTTTKT